MIFLLYCTYHTDYHWDCHLYFVIIPSMHRLYSYLLGSVHDSYQLTFMTHTTTDTSSIHTMTSLSEALHTLLRAVSHKGIAE
jgi:hypothetical protein